MKEGVMMRPNVTFIDQTLSFALRQGRIDIPGFMRLKQKATAMGRVIFDLPLNLLQKTEGQVAIDLHDVRLGIMPEVKWVQLATELGCQQVKIKLNLEMPPEVIESVLEATRECGLQVTLHGINIGKYSLTEIDFLETLVKGYPIAHLLIDDSDSRLDPLSTYWTLRKWREFYPVELEYCGRNQRGLATGNTLGAVKSGVQRLVVSIGGVGGFSAWEEVGMGIKYLLKLPLDIPADLAISCRKLLGDIRVDIAANKPIIGSNIFSHESGIHVDGVIKKSELYEPFAPEDVGLSRQIIIGKHSGKAALEAKLKELNVDLKHLDLIQILERVRQLAVAQKAPVIDEQLQQLVKEVV